MTKPLLGLKTSVAQVFMQDSHSHVARCTFALPVVHHFRLSFSLSPEEKGTSVNLRHLQDEVDAGKKCTEVFEPNFIQEIKMAIRF